MKFQDIISFRNIIGANTGKIDNFKPFKVYGMTFSTFQFLLKSALILSTYKHVLNDNKKECHTVFTYMRISA